MALFEVTDYDRKVYEEELRDFLPEKMIDIHTHLWRREFLVEAGLVPKISPRVVAWPSMVANTNPIEDLQETYRLMFPGKEVTAVCFNTSRPNDVQNAYVAESTARVGYAALYGSYPEETAEELEQHIREGGFLGVKSYLSRSPAYLPTKEIRIYDFYPKHQLAVLDKLGGIVMLHIPRDGRLKDQVNIQQILEIEKEFPNLKLIIAHIGRAYTKGDIGDAFEYLDTCPNLYYDFSANCCQYAIEEVLRHAGTKRVLFGSDLPVLRMRTRRIEENGTYINLIPPGLYGDPNQDSHLREVTPEEAEKITFFMYEELLAFKRAAKNLGLTAEDVNDILYQNARDLLDEAKASIYGV